MNSKGQDMHLEKFIEELPYTITSYTPYFPNLSIAGNTATGKTFSLILDFNWEIYHQSEIISWDNYQEQIQKKIVSLIGQQITQIFGPDNGYDATYLLTDGGFIRGLTSADQFGSHWALRIKDDKRELFTGRIDPYLAIQERTNFLAWDRQDSFAGLTTQGFPTILLDAIITEVKGEDRGQHQLLHLEILSEKQESYRLSFWDSWALYTKNRLVVAGDFPQAIEDFSVLMRGKKLESFEGRNELGFYGCSLIFGSVRLRQIGSSEPGLSWQIWDDQGQLLWRAPTDAEANQGLIQGVAGTNR